MTSDPTRTRLYTMGAVALIVLAAWGARSLETRPARRRVAPSSKTRLAVEPDAARDASDAGLRDLDAAEDAGDDSLPRIPELPLQPVAAPPSARTPSAPLASAAPAVRLSAVDGEQEITLLEKAQVALVFDPSQALTLADEDARRFSRGPMREQAEVIAIDALQRLGRRPFAEARARKFRAAYPTSTHLRWVDAILARGP